MQRVLGAQPLKKAIGELAIGLAVDCDDPEEAVEDLIRANLPDASRLPFVAFLTPDGRWILGASGYQEMQKMQQMLTEANASPLLNASAEVQKALAKTAASATAAAEKGDWKAVLTAASQAKKTKGRCAERTAIAVAEAKARGHAAAELDAVVAAARKGEDLAALRKRLTELRRPFAGEPEAVECDTGIKALQRLQLVREVEARGNPAKDLRPRSKEPFAGTRWTAVFDLPTESAPDK